MNKEDFKQQTKHFQAQLREEIVPSNEERLSQLLLQQEKGIIIDFDTEPLDQAPWPIKWRSFYTICYKDATVTLGRIYDALQTLVNEDEENRS